jgi:phosphohistidine swiveling domain-containing protein
MDWRVPDGDDARTWRKGWGGPHPRLEQDWWLRSAEHEVACWRSIGAFTCMLAGRAYVNGWPFDLVPDDPPEEVQARRDAHSAKGEAAIDAGSDLWEAEIRPEVEAIHAGLRRRRPRSDTNLPGLVAHVERCMDAAGHIMGDLHWRMAFGIPGEWTEEYPRLTGGTVGEAAVFLQGLDHATSRLLRRLRHLARLQRDGDPAYEDAFAELLRRYGTRTGRGYGSASGFRDTTWSLEPQAVHDLIAQYARADLDELEAREEAARRARQAAVRRIRRRHGGTEQWPALERAHRAAIARCRAMENHNHLMEQATEGMLREAIHRLGAGLVAAGVLDHHDDVFHLHVAELRDLAARPTDARTLVAERKAELEAQAALEVPPFLGAPPQAPPGFGDPGERPPVGERPPDELPGTGASPGVVTGRARVVPDTAGFPEVDPGDVLVARDAGPAWTPIFALLGGLVLDQGWAIQHAAIVCRELGIPCVLGTGTATTAIADGATITVDGDAGLVRMGG